VREEAKRHGRDPKSIAVSATNFQLIISESAAASRATAEQMAGMFGVTPAELPRLPIFLIRHAGGMRRRAQAAKEEWDLSEVIFSYPGPDVMRRLGEEILPQVK